MEQMEKHPMQSSLVVILNRLSKATAAMIVLVLLTHTGIVRAQMLCDSSFSRYDFEQEDPDLSHPIYQENRWRCVTRTFDGLDINTSYAPSLVGFSAALSECQSQATSAAFTTNAPNYQIVYGLVLQTQNLVAQSGILNDSFEQENACFLIDDGPNVDEDIRDIESYSTTLIPTTYVHYSGTIDGQTNQAAHLIPWSGSNSQGDSLPSITVEYVPESEQSLCFDPLCQPSATTAAQLEHSPIEPGLGTVDYAIPIFPSGFPGLVPISLHYSSHGAIRQAEEAYNSGAFYDIRGWHHSYDKRLREGTFGVGLRTPDASPKQLFIRTPSEDLLIFELNSFGAWANVSHPGVTTTIHQTVEDEYEARRPDGYLERYDDSGKLVFVRYPDGRALTITSGIDMSGTYGFFYDDIIQSYPPAITRVYKTFSGEPLFIQSLENLEYGVQFVYNFHPIFEDVFPQLAQIIRPDGSVFGINQSLDLDKFTENRPLLNSVSFNGTPIFSASYDTDGKALSVSDVDGLAYLLSYNGEGASSITSRFGAVYQQNTEKVAIHQTDHWGELSNRSVTNVDCGDCGFSESTTYQANGVIASQSRIGDRPFTASYNATGLVESVSLDNSKQRNFSWNDDQRQLTELSGSDVVTTRFSYTDDRVTSTTFDGGDSSRIVSTPHVNGQITEISGIGNNVTSIAYNLQGFVTRVEDSSQRAHELENHNHLGQPRLITDPNGIQTLVTYDIMGKVLTIMRDGVQKLTAEYTPAGQPAIVMLNGRVLQYSYDDAFNLKKVTNADGQEVDINYLANGLIGQVSRSHNGLTKRAEFEYNSQGHTTGFSQVFANGAIQRSFNSRGQVTQKTDGPNIAIYNYDSNAYLTSITDNGEQTQLQRDALGRLTSLTTDGGQQTTFSYTGLGEQTQQLNSNWGYRNYAYGPTGLLTAESTPLRTRSYNYTGSDEVLSRTAQHNDTSIPTITTRYGYNDDSFTELGKNYGIGRLTSIENGYAGYEYRYNRQGALTSIAIDIDEAGSPDPLPLPLINPDGHIEYHYDENSQLTGLSYPSGDQIDYVRDPISLKVTQLTRNNTLVAEFTHANQLQPATRIEFGNQVVTTRQFDDWGRATRIKTGVDLWQEAYIYNAAKNLESIVTTSDLEVGGSQLFGYNVRNQLRSAIGEYGRIIYRYDDNNNHTRLKENGVLTFYHYETDSNRLVSISGSVVKTLSYDENGNTTQFGIRTFHYDAEGRLGQVLEEGAVLATYTYDAYGQRVRKTTASGSLYFRYGKNGQLLEEVDAAGGLVRQYIYSEEGDLIALYVAALDQLLAVHSDFLGAPIFLTDSDKNVVWSAKRKPFGETEVTVNTVEFPMRVSNQYFDQETGYHYNGQRYYDPLTARYLRNDPIGLEGGHNTYNFALKNPLKYVDLDGRYAETPLEAISIAIGLTSLVYNASNGNVVDSLIDVGGLVVDAIGVVIPVAPGVSSAAIASYRASKSLDTVVAKSAEGIVDATKGADKFVVLGEGMGHIKTVAKQLQSQGVNAKWYQAWGKNFPANRPMNSGEMAAALSRNERWIRSKIKNGYKFFDIGIDATRSVRSPFYKLEQSIIKETGTKTTTLSRPN
jgi:RHS repeat-associated protein